MPERRRSSRRERDLEWTWDISFIRGRSPQRDVVDLTANLRLIEAIRNELQFGEHLTDRQVHLMSVDDAGEINAGRLSPRSFREKVFVLTDENPPEGCCPIQL